jgi:hypothetical protein
MRSGISSDKTEKNNDTHSKNRGTGSYWVRIDDSWFLTMYFSNKNQFYFPGYFDGVDPKELHEIDERKLDKKFEGYKKKSFDITEQSKPARLEGYYWVLHDAMWFATFYRPSIDEFFFSGQTIGFNPSDLDEIDELRIERNKS